MRYSGWAQCDRGVSSNFTGMPLWSLFPAHMQEELVIFIGLRDEVGNNQLSDYRWTVDDSKLTYSNFNPGEPNSVWETCVGMETKHDLRWADIVCNVIISKRPALCESNPVSSKLFPSSHFFYNTMTINWSVRSWPQAVKLKNYKQNVNTAEISSNFPTRTHH